MPREITESAANAMQEKVLDLMPDITNFYPPLMLSYATGKREADAKGTGPGLVYAAQLALRFHGVGVPCFTGLHVPSGADWKLYFTKLDSRASKCSVFIVLQTVAFYQSMNCLKEVATALSCKKVTKIIPVRMEEGLPGKDEQWSGLDIGDPDKLQMLTDVQAGLGKLNSFPARGTLLDDAAYLDQLLEMVTAELGLPAPAVEMGGAAAYEMLALMDKLQVSAVTPGADAATPSPGNDGGGAAAAVAPAAPPQRAPPAAALGGGSAVVLSRVKRSSATALKGESC